jgi:TonB family protein
MPIQKLDLDVNTLDIDYDGKADHLTFRVQQTGEKTVSIQSFVSLAKDEFRTYTTSHQKTFTLHTSVGWQLSNLKLQANKLLLTGEDGTGEGFLLNDVSDTIAAEKQKHDKRIAAEMQTIDKKIVENAGIMGAMQDNALSQMPGQSGLSSDVQGGIGGLIGAKGTQIGSGGLGARAGGLGGGGTAEGLGGLAKKGAPGNGKDSGYGTGGGNFGKHGEGGIGTVGGEPIILGALDRSLIDEVVKRHMNQIRYCYQRELTSNPKLAGKIVIKITIAKDGTVSSAQTKSSSMNNAKVENAICERFLKMQFPQPKGGGIVIVSYPFEFKPE